MSIQVRDQITPDLAKKIKALADRRPVLEAAGLTLVSITQRAFDDPSLRPSPWPPRKDQIASKGVVKRDERGRFLAGPHPLLRKTGNLWHSITVTEITNDSVSVGSNAVYAAIQQLGSRKSSGRGSGIPPRPFFPVTAAGVLTALAQSRVWSVMKRKYDSIMGQK